MITYSLLCLGGLLPNIWQGYAGFSDWRGVGQCDFATNAPVAQYYNGGDPLYLRMENVEEYFKRLRQGQTLIVGVDYYAFHASRQFMPAFPDSVWLLLSEGKVMKFQVFLIDSMSIYWRHYE